MRGREASRGRKRAFTVLVLATVGLSLGVWRVPAQAQEAQNGQELASQFGGFQVSSRANGIQVTYDSPGLLPISPIVQVSIPESLATVAPGPTTYALGGMAFPGPILGNLPALFAQAGAPPVVPDYPLRVESRSPSGPADDEQAIATGAARTRATSASSEAVTTYTGADLPGFLRIGGMTSSTYSALEQGQVVSRARVELAGVDLLFGLIHIDSIVTDLVSTSDGRAAASDGGTRVSGVSVLGVSSTLDGNGLTVAPSPDAPASPLDPVSDSLPDLGTPLSDALASVSGPLSDLMTSVLGTVTTSVNELFAAGGISVRVLEPSEIIEGPAATRRANGLVIEIDYDGETAPVFSDLLDAIPADQLPDENLPGIPIPSSPQALVKLLSENHVTRIAIGLAEVNTVASPSFRSTPTTPTGSSLLPSISIPGTPAIPGTPGFTTPTPTTSSGDSTDSESVPASFLGPGLAPFLILAVLLTSPLWGIGSSRMADNVIGATGTSCPDGRD